MKIHILGARGSMPTGGKDFVKYGADTSCYLIETKDYALFMDAGSGICHTPQIDSKNIYIFLSHPHLDHLLGLTFFPYLSDEDRTITICAALPELEIKTTLDRVFSLPFWPCTIEDYGAKIVYKNVSEGFLQDDIDVQSIRGSHPGGARVFKVQAEDKTVVYATDYEHNPKKDEALIEFSKNADLLIYDAQYTSEEYETMRGFGHSTVENGLKIQKASGAKKIIFTHHDPRHNDELLEKLETEMILENPNASFAKQGEVVEL